MKETVDLEMYTHVFGGTSSPPCSNSALRRTTAETKKLCGSGASDTLNRNIQVDDLLELVKTVQEAVTLIGNVTGMCATGQVNLTKLTSNTKEVLMAIPEERVEEQRTAKSRSFTRCNSSRECT